MIQENEEEKSNFILISSKDIAIRKQFCATIVYYIFSNLPPYSGSHEHGRIQILTLFKSIPWLHFVTAKSYGQQRQMKQRQRAEVAPKSNSELADLHETALLTPHSE